MFGFHFYQYGDDPANKVLLHAKHAAAVNKCEFLPVEGSEPHPMPQGGMRVKVYCNLSKTELKYYDAAVCLLNNWHKKHPGGIPYDENTDQPVLRLTK